MSILNQPILNNIAKSVSNPTIASSLDFGSNLFDKLKDELNTTLISSGAVSSFTGLATSDYIPVNKSVYPTLKYIYRFSVTSAAIYRCIFYRRDYTAITESYSQDISIGALIDIPEDAAYFRFTHQTHVNGYDCVLNYGNKKVSWFDLRYTEPSVRVKANDELSNEYNLFNENLLIKDYRIDYATSEPRAAIGSICTGLINVKPNTNYFIHNQVVSNANWVLHMYDDRKNRIDARYYISTITTPSNCYYVAINYEIPNEASCRNGSFFLVEANRWDGVIGDVIADNDKILATKSNKALPITDMRICAVYENHVVIQSYMGGSMYYSSTGWKGNFTEVALTTANFPNLKSGAYVSNVVFFNTNSGVRCIVFFSNNQLYSSTTGSFSGFVIPDIWDLPGNKHWRVSDTDKDPTGQRYRAYFPSDIETRVKAFTWHNGPVWLNGIGGQYSRGLCFVNYSDTYSERKPVQSCMFFTEDGKNIYIQYGFGVYQKFYKFAEGGEVKSSVSHNYGDSFDSSILGTYTGGLSLKKRWNILPSATNTDPAKKFEYSTPVTVTAISGGDISLSDATNISVGDVVLFTGESSGFDKITNNTASDNIGGNVAFVVKTKSGNIITVADAIGNLNNNLMCRHIHGLGEFSQGLIIYTGEEFPESYFIYVNPYCVSVSEGVNMNNIKWFEDTVRLNSSATAHQRALGMYLRSDGKCIAIADSNSPTTSKLTIRGKDIKMGNYGVHIFNLDDIDDASKSISKIPAVNAGYALYHIGGILLYSDYYGITYYSEDEGDSWKYICTDGTNKSDLIGFDKNKKRFFFNTTRGKHFVLEIK